MSDAELKYSEKIGAKIAYGKTSSGTLVPLLVDSDGKPLVVGGAKYFELSANLTRPANTTAYTAGDAVSDGIPSLLEFDLSAVGAVAGQAIQIVGAVVAVGTPWLASPMFTLWISNDSDFAATADNSPISVADAINEACIRVKCQETGSSALNQRAESGAISEFYELASDDTKLYVQPALTNAPTPVSGDKITATLRGLLL